MLHRDKRKSRAVASQKKWKQKNPEYLREWKEKNPEYDQEWKRNKVANETKAERCIAELCWFILVSRCVSSDCLSCTVLQGNQRRQSISKSGSEIKLPMRQQLRGALQSCAGSY